jgi:hypothetical protein
MTAIAGLIRTQPQTRAGTAAGEQRRLTAHAADMLGTGVPRPEDAAGLAS